MSESTSATYALLPDFATPPEWVHRLHGSRAMAGGGRPMARYRKYLRDHWQDDGPYWKGQPRPNGRNRAVVMAAPTGTRRQAVWRAVTRRRRMREWAKTVATREAIAAMGEAAGRAIEGLSECMGALSDTVGQIASTVDDALWEVWGRPTMAEAREMASEAAHEEVRGAERDARRAVALSAAAVAVAGVAALLGVLALRGRP